MPMSEEPLTVLDILRSIPESVVTIDRDKRLVALNELAQVLAGDEGLGALHRHCGRTGSG
jgi:hypothetical protein